jgi:hypothetical protein
MSIAVDLHRVTDLHAIGRRRRSRLRTDEAASALE